MGLELIDPNNPEKGYMVVGRLPHIPEYEHKLGELSVTDGVPIPTEDPLKANFGSIERFQEERATQSPSGQQHSTQRPQPDV